MKFLGLLVFVTVTLCEEVIKSGDKIVGGQIAEPNSFPFQVNATTRNHLNLPVSFRSECSCGGDRKLPCFAEDRWSARSTSYLLVTAWRAPLGRSSSWARTIWSPTRRESRGSSWTQQASKFTLISTFSGLKSILGSSFYQLPLSSRRLSRQLSCHGDFFSAKHFRGNSEPLPDTESTATIVDRRTSCDSLRIWYWATTSARSGSLTLQLQPRRKFAWGRKLILGILEAAGGTLEDRWRSWGTIPLSRWGIKNLTTFNNCLHAL